MEADAASLAIDRAERRAEAIGDPRARFEALGEILEARDALGVARSGAFAAARTKDDVSLSEIEDVVESLRAWAEAFPTARPPRTPRTDPGAPGSPRRP